MATNVRRKWATTVRLFSVYHPLPNLGGGGLYTGSRATYNNVIVVFSYSYV